MSFKCLLLLLALTVVCVTNNSCSKSALSEPSSTDTTITPIDTTNTPKDTSSINVYIAGDTVIEGFPYAAYWKNGAITEIPSGRYSWATSVSIYNNDVYLAVQGSTADTFTYWKNRSGIVLPDSLASHDVATALTISDGDIYATGTGIEFHYLDYSAVYWKNNDFAVHLVPFDPPVSHNSWGKAIAVSNKDIYIAGYLDDSAVYWKNGEIVPLPVDPPFNYDYSIANSICIDQRDVYVAGIVNMSNQYTPYYRSIACYWKNNKPVRLTKDTGSIANAITVLGKDIYVAGAIYGADELTRAAYWKNGALVVLDSNYSVANTIVVHGEDVFIGGTIGDHQATYWKNGIPISLGSGHVNAIFITDK